MAARKSNESLMMTEDQSMVLTTNLNNADLMTNVLFEDLQIGQTASQVRILSNADVRAFAAITGDANPAHLDANFADQTPFHGVIAHGMLGGGLISMMLGTRLPGPGTIYLKQDLHFVKPVKIGDTLTISVKVKSKDKVKKQVTLFCQIVNQHGLQVIYGDAVVIAPTERIAQAHTRLPSMAMFDSAAQQAILLRQVKSLKPPRCAVVHPCDIDSLTGAIEAARQELIIPILVGPIDKLKAVARLAGIDLSHIEIVDVPHSHAAAEKAALMAETKLVDSMMKGSLHTDELMHAVTRCVGLRTKRRMSHVFYLNIPLYSKVLLLTDAVLNIHPTLLEKADILQNAINLALALQIASPKVAILSAVETVTPQIESTLDAAALCKMVERKQIVGGIVDGPLAFDNAISAEAARIKGIASPISGHADILMVPDLESGNMLVKQLEYLAGASTCGVVVGARVPIALTSRADSVASRVASAALVKLLANDYQSHTP
jgi:phosphate acetyltransferase